MVKKSISGYLTAALGRSSAELLILTVTFLKKLSILSTLVAQTIFFFDEIHI